MNEPGATHFEMRFCISKQFCFEKLSSSSLCEFSRRLWNIWGMFFLLSHRLKIPSLAGEKCLLQGST